MPFSSLEQDRPYLMSKFQNPVFEKDSGEDQETLKRKVGELAEQETKRGVPHPVIKGRAFEYLVRNMQIQVSPHDWFVGFGCWNRRDRPVGSVLGIFARELNRRQPSETTVWMEEGNRAGLFAMWMDFDHSAPDWDAVLALGFPGLLERARRYRSEREKAGKMTEEAAAYFDGIEITYSAILDTLKRLLDSARRKESGEKRIASVAECLEHLIQGPPRNTYEVLHLIYLYFFFGEHIDHVQVRTLGNLDRLIFPYYERDLKSGRFTEAEIREFFAYFMMQYASIDNYWGHPFYLGGTKAGGESEVNALSYLILDVFDELCIPTPKIQIKTAENTPVPFLKKALDMIRHGNNSLVFVCEESVKRAMMGIGYSEEIARTCDITGCYECAPRGCSNKTAPAYINLLKTVELVFHNGVDPATGIDCGFPVTPLESMKSFDDFYLAVIQTLGHVIERVLQCANGFERHLHLVNPAQVFSATVTHSLEVAKDAFSNGSIYNNSIILSSGFGTMIDALAAVREFVFERNEVSLTEFREILDRNWEGREDLRRRILHSPLKYGNNIASVDFYAEAVARYFSARINLRPNARGGFFEASAHSARTFLTLGEKTGATPDGRMAGEEMSKNISPTMGMDVNGVTALIQSVCRIDSAQFPGDFPLDVMLHPATVEGEDGLDAMLSVLNVYRKQHGVAIHFNIVDAETLRKAQEHPNQYRGLQIRVCGWNVRFHDLCKKEQDAYLLRARNLME